MEYMMTYHTTCRNIRELNAKLRQAGENVQYIFAGFMQSSEAGYAHKTRHYIAEIISGENAGATTGDYVEICFSTPYTEGWRRD